MNKLVIFLLFSFVIIGINSDCETDGAVSGPEECWLRRLSGDQTHCCYVEEDMKILKNIKIMLKIFMKWK